MTELLKLDAADARDCDNKNLVQWFNHSTEKHEMTILHDDGLYRHLHFADPANSIYWFDLITWPGSLTIKGDMGTWTFSRLTDMFEFFTGYINTSYWAEKLDNGTEGGRRCAREYDDEAFKKWLVRDFWETSRDMESHRIVTDWWNTLREEFFSCYGSWRDDSNTAIRQIYDLEVPRLVAEHYQDVYESSGSWEPYTSHFEWCLAAIVAGISTYNQHKES